MCNSYLPQLPEGAPRTAFQWRDGGASRPHRCSWVCWRLGPSRDIWDLVKHGLKRMPKGLYSILISYTAKNRALCIGPGLNQGSSCWNTLMCSLVVCGNACVAIATAPLPHASAPRSRRPQLPWTRGNSLLAPTLPTDAECHTWMRPEGELDV